MISQPLNTLGLSLIVSLGNPLELIKSRFQTMNELIDRGTIQKKYQGVIDCIKSIKIHQGARAFWKGNSISIARFFVNENINNEAKNITKALLPNSTFSNIGAGVIGGWSAAAILYPIDTIRFFIATSIQKSTETIKQLSGRIRNDGFKYLFRGYGSSLFNIALFRGTYFGMFDSLKEFTNKNQQKWAAAYLSGLSAGLIVYPIQTIRKKKIITNKSEGYSSIIYRTLKTEGISGFYRGCIFTPFQSLVGAAVLMYFDSRQQNL